MKFLATTLLGCLLAGIAATSQAGAYRCKDAQGRTTYSQTPCKTGQTEQNMSHVQRSSKPGMAEACGAARKFAGEIYEKLQDGNSVDAVIDEYGGVNYIEKPVLTIINFVGTFQYQTDTPINKVQSLTRSKCRNGGFGEFAADDLPLKEEPMMYPPYGMPPNGYPVAQPNGTPPAYAPAPDPNAKPSEAQIKQMEEYLERIKEQNK